MNKQIVMEKSGNTISEISLGNDRLTTAGAMVLTMPRPFFNAAIDQLRKFYRPFKKLK